MDIRGFFSGHTESKNNNKGPFKRNKQFWAYFWIKNDDGILLHYLLYR